MGKRSKPHSGSIAYYPRKRAAKETASFRAFPSVLVKEGEKGRPLNFLAYKAGMTHVLGRDAHQGGVNVGHEVAVSATVLEAPPLKVFGIRAYGKAPVGSYGVVPLMDVLAENVDKSLLRRLHGFKKKVRKKQRKEPEKKPKTVSDLDAAKEKVAFVRILCHSLPGRTNFGKKTPDICEVALSGNAGQQLAFAREKLGHEISVSDVFSDSAFVDIKAVTKGKGMQGVVKRFGIKSQRPKSQKVRVVGSLGPWNPSTIMFQVARPGQMGYHSRTEFNKRVLKIGSAKEIAVVNPKGGFKNYGVVANDFVILAGSVAGPVKRAISLRAPVRLPDMQKHKLESLDYVAASAEEKEIAEEEVKAGHVVAEKEQKQEKKSVADEIASAVKGEKK